MPVSAKVICDSVSPRGDRLTTVELTMHRFVLAELNTHRAFCLAGDAVIEFDLPGGARGGRRVHRMRVDEFVDKWHGGARRIGTNPRKPTDFGRVDDDALYDGREAAALIGHASPSNLHLACRTGALPAVKDGRRWLVRGSDLKAWRAAVPAHARFDMRDRLRAMRIRQVDERTGMVTTSTVADCWQSGVKPVYVLRAGGREVAGSADHLILTPDGYRRIGDLRPGDPVVVQRWGKRPEDLYDPNRLKLIGGQWRSVWQRKQREQMIAEDPTCRKCGDDDRLQVHHITPVHVAPDLAFEPTNVTLLCEACHHAQHERQGWQGGTYLYGGTAKVESITYRGDEPTYDLTIAGEFPNFVANGIVVHNSRNSASSRAIPVAKQLDRVRSDPAMPLEWGRNQSGMQADTVLDLDVEQACRETWLRARDAAVEAVERLAELSLHKQVANRLLEPFMWHTVIVSGTDAAWSGFFEQRCSPLAQPEIRAAADAARIAMAGSAPARVGEGGWHLPYVLDDERRTLPLPTLRKISTARCARVSLLTHDGRRAFEADVDLYGRLVTARPAHASPLEHVATPTVGRAAPCNFVGWSQLRHMVLGF